VDCEQALCSQILKGGLPRGANAELKDRLSIGGGRSGFGGGGGERMRSLKTGFRLWCAIAGVLRVVAFIVLLALLYLLSSFETLPIGSGSITPQTAFWKLIVPLVPALLLVMPSVWRNICPLAYLNHIGHLLRTQINGKGYDSSQSRLNLSKPGIRLWLSRYGTHAAVFLLLSIVPARIFLFNSAPRALLALLLVLMAAAFLMGLALPLKSGWCSSICPVYPVENLYAISPFLYMDNTLCADKVPASKPQMLCNGCTRHCLDLKIGAAAGKSRKAGTRWRPRRVVRTLINSFPGFLIAYWLLDSNSIMTEISGISGALISYAIFAIAMFVSFSLCSLARRSLYKESKSPLATGKHIDLALVAASFNLYYWIAIPSSVKTAVTLLGVTDCALIPTTVLMLAGVAVLSLIWLRRAW
jgi:polyferredoxin